MTTPPNENAAIDQHLDYSIHYSHLNPDTAEFRKKRIEDDKKQIEAFLEFTSKGRALDIGCGVGFTLEALKESGFTSVEGIDSSGEQIKVCHQHRLTAHLTTEPIEFLKSHAGQFDVITMFDVLEHIPIASQYQTMCAIYTALSPTGTLIVKVPNAAHIFAAISRYGDFTHQCLFTHLSLRHLVLGAGFKEMQIKDYERVGRPPVRLWRKSVRKYLWSWFFRKMWQETMECEMSWLGPTPLGMCFVAAARKVSTRA